MGKSHLLASGLGIIVSPARVQLNRLFEQVGVTSGAGIIEGMGGFMEECGRSQDTKHDDVVVVGVGPTTALEQHKVASALANTAAGEVLESYAS